MEGHILINTFVERTSAFYLNKVFTILQEKKNFK